MADYGSSALGEGHNFGHAANFIAWLGPDKPDIVFFANHYDGFAHDPQVRVPLQGDGRSIGMYWGPRTLTPGQNQLFTLAIIPTTVSTPHTVPAVISHPRKS